MANDNAGLENKVEILGVRVSNVTKEQAKAKVVNFLHSANQYKIFTPNPEMIVKAQKDQYFKEVLNSGDLNLCDGFGLWLALQLLKHPNLRIERISGVDSMVEICKIAAEQGKSIYLLGSGSDIVVEQTAHNLQDKFPNLKIVGWDKGPRIDESNLDSKENDATVHKINTAKPDILFVAFGMGKQEKWIYKNLQKLPSVKIAMGVGGSFDFISGRIKRAPLFLRKLGLEWLYRLLQEPKRIGRILNATVKFVFLVLKSK